MALMNRVKEVKPDRSISDNKLKALASRSLFAQPPRHGAGSRIAPTTAKERMAVKNKTEVVEKRVESIHYGYVNRKTTKVAREITVWRSEHDSRWQRETMLVILSHLNPRHKD